VAFPPAAQLNPAPRPPIIIGMKWKGWKWAAAVAGFGLGIVYSLYLGCWGL
jgi:hypothetical protein